jgi:hypothetical protein
MAMARVLLFGLFLWLSLHSQCMATRAIKQDDKGKGEDVGVDDNTPFISPSTSPLVDDSLLTDSPSAFDDNATSPLSSPLVDDSLLTDSPSALDDDESPAPVPVPLSFVDDNMSPPTYSVLEPFPSPLPPSPPPVNSGSYRTSTNGVMAMISILLFLFM